MGGGAWSGVRCMNNDKGTHKAFICREGCMVPDNGTAKGTKAAR